LYKQTNQDVYSNSIIFSLFYVGKPAILISLIDNFPKFSNSEIMRRSEILILKFKIALSLFSKEILNDETNLHKIYESQFRPNAVSNNVKISKWNFYLAASSSNEYPSKKFETVVVSQLTSLDILNTLIFLKGLSVFNNDIFSKYKKSSKHDHVFGLFDELTSKKEKFSFDRCDTFDKAQKELDEIIKTIEITKEQIVKLKTEKKTESIKEKNENIKSMQSEARLLKSFISKLKNIKLNDFSKYSEFMQSINLKNYSFLDKIFFD
jgi:hypothetical protein